MRQAIEKLAHIIAKDSEEEREIVIYGFTMAIEIFFNILTTIVLAVLFDMVVEMAIFSISFLFLRSYCGGIHGRNGLECYVLSSTMLVGVLAVQKWDYLSQEHTTVIMTIGIVLILLIAPIGDANKPLEEIERIVYRKKVYLLLVIHIGVFVIAKVFMMERVLMNISISIVVVSVSLVLGKVKNKFK